MTELEKAVALLAATYRDDFPDDRVKAYMGLLEDLEGQAVLAAVVRLCKREKFSPAVAEIRREVAEMMVALPSAVAAYAMAGDKQVPIHDLPMEVKEALNLMGGRWELTRTTEPGMFWSQFMKVYGEIREHSLLKVVEGRRVAPALPHSSSLVLRPVATRLARRLGGEPAEPVTDEMKADAIRILGEGPHTVDPAEDLLFTEASVILDLEGR